MMRLYDYFRSSASYRVRIALNLKQLNAQLQEVHLVKNGGEQHLESYFAINPQKLVPALEEDGKFFTQSLAIIEYLEERFPDPPLLPDEPVKRAQARALAQIISCDIHPLNNLRVLQYLKKHFSSQEEDIQGWYHHWIKEGFFAFEKQLASVQENPHFCIGHKPGIADICLIPQVYNAKRFNVALDDFPRIQQIDAWCHELSAFQQASPDISSDK